MKSPADRISPQERPPRLQVAVLISAAVSYAALLTAFWFTARHFDLEDRTGGHFASAFASFALLLIPYWGFGFGGAAHVRQVLRGPISRVVTPGLLLLPYLIFAAPRGILRADMAISLFAIPIGIAAIFEFIPPGGLRGSQVGLTWQDVVVLLAVGVPIEFGLLRAAWPYSGLTAMPKFLMVDAALYAFLVVRGLDGIGYDFRPRLRDLLIGLREWSLFAPIAIGLGFALGFIVFRPYLPDPWSVAAAWLITFFFVAIPEELFFRGLLMNLLERRVGTTWALVMSAVIFGLSHFNKPLPFNWRYVLLATIAGIFYGRAWSNRRRLLTSGITHATVDVVWGLWFR